MTALQWIIKEAKIIRKKSPKMEWKKAVAQASAIYASKHKGKSPVGKKKAAPKKKAAKKRKVAGVKASKEVKKVLAKKGLKMPHGYSTTKRKRKVGAVKKKKISEQSILNKIHKVKHDVERLDEAQHKHMVGMNNDIYHKMALINTEIIAKERGIRKWMQLKKGLVSKYGLAHYKKIQNNQRKMINELKKHKAELKKIS